MKEKLTEFKQILNDNAITELGKEFEIENKRKRKISLPVFFWLMVMSCKVADQVGCLSGLCALFATAMSNLFKDENPVNVTKAALSKKMSKVSWLFFKDVFNRLLKQYQKILPENTKEKLVMIREKLLDIKVVDSTVMQVCKKLEAFFASTKEGIATIKINVRMSLLSNVPDKINVTEGKCHDRNFKFLEPMKNILYIFDLGYYKHAFFDRLFNWDCFFISRLKFTSSPIVLKALDKSSPRNVQGLSLMDICQKATHGTLDLLIELGKTHHLRMRNHVRLIGVFHNDQWYFYITNLFDRSLKPQDFYILYSQRWQIEILFNQIKTYLSLDRIFSRTRNGIMIQIYSALIFFLLCQIVLTLAAEKSGRKHQEFSFKLVIDYVAAYLKGTYSLLSPFHTTDFLSLFDRLICVIACIPRRSYSPNTVFY